MKKILIFILCILFAFGGALAEAMPGSALEAYGPPAPGEKLGFALLNKLYSGGANSIISPQSLMLALGMAAEGAQGDTLAEILAALDVEDASQIAANLPEGLKSANAAFTAPELFLKQEYIDRLNEGYNAEWFKIDAEVVDNVNAWVKDNTDGLIEQLITDAPDPQTGMILLNAVAMDAEWTHAFTPQATQEEIFHALGGDVTVQMMHQTEYFDYAEKDGVQIIRLPYRAGSLEMWIAMPEVGGMPALLNTLANEGMFYLKSDAKLSNVTFGLPKMDIAASNTLSDALKQLGVENPFGTEADFSGISDTPLYIDSILQKVRVQVDEAGTKAAAATALIMKAYGMLGGVEEVQMIVDRPFVFVISDAETGSVCFAGAIENPVEK